MSTTIEGHPAVTAIAEKGREIRITVCAECGALSSILWLVSDRWYCRECRAEGVGGTTTLPLSNPARRR